MKIKVKVYEKITPNTPVREILWGDNGIETVDGEVYLVTEC